MQRGWKVLLVTSPAVYLVYLDATVVNVAFPALSSEFASAGRAAVSWVLSAYSIAFAASLFTAGRVADQSGRRRSFFLGMALFTGASLLCSLAPSLGLLIAARVLQAVGAAFVMPASLALVLPEFPREKRSTAVGVWSVIGGVAAATGPSVGSALIHSAGWRTVFLINIPVCLAAWLAGRRILAESRGPAGQGLPDLLGAGVGASAISLLVLALLQVRHWGWGDPRTLAAFAGAGLLLLLFVWRSSRHRSPILDLQLVRQRFFASANLAAFLFAMAFFGMLFVQPLFLTQLWRLSILDAGLALTPGPLIAAAVAGPAGKLADRIGHRWLSVPGTLVFAFGVLWLVWQAGPDPDWRWVFIPSMVAGGIGVGLTLTTLSSAASAFLPATRFAVGSAFSTTVRQVGAALGVAVLVLLLGPSGGAPSLLLFQRAWIFLALAALTAGLIMLVAYLPPPAGEPPSRQGAPGNG